MSAGHHLTGKMFVHMYMSGMTYIDKNVLGQISWKILDEPNEEIRDIDFLLKHLLYSALPNLLDVLLRHKLSYFVYKEVKILWKEGVAKLVFFLQFIGHGESPCKGIAFKGRCTENSCFGGHGLAVTNEHRGVVHE